LISDRNQCGSKSNGHARFAKAEKGISRLSPDARWPVGGADALQSDFDVIERNHYDVFRQRAYVPRMPDTDFTGCLLRSQVL